MDREVYGISGAGARRARGPLIPNGAIVMLNTTTIPSSMTRFSAADDRFIVCAGDQFSPSETGGSCSGFSVQSQANGSHIHDYTQVTTTDVQGGTPGYGVYPGYAGDYSGGHGHEITFDAYPLYQGVVLAEVNAWLTEFPANAIVLSVDSTDWGLTRIFTDGYYAKAQDSIATGGGSVTNISVANAGYHAHEAVNPVYSSGSLTLGQNFSSGTHTHSCSGLSVTWPLSAFSVAALTSTSVFDIQSGMIIFWRSLDPPIGWKICDGTNGAPDMRNYFLKFCAVGDEGTTDGTNNLHVTGSLDSENAAHDHTAGIYASEGDSGMVVARDWIHDHSVDATLSNVLPPYYGLVPIMKA